MEPSRFYTSAEVSDATHAPAAVPYALRRQDELAKHPLELLTAH